MPANPLIFKDAEKARDALLVSQKKEIAALYQQWADEIGERANYYAHKSTASSVVSERQMRELQKMMEETSQQVANEVYNDITRNLYTVADSVVRCNDEWLASLGFNSGTVDAIFNYVPDDIVRNIVSGQIYDSGWSLSSRIWSDNEDTMKQAYQIVAGGVAQNKPMYEIAKDLEKYVSPSAAKPWNLRAPDGKKIYPKDVDYNAQRLGRTLVQHGYQQSFVATTQKNPFITDYIWISNGSRVCDLCAERDGKHFSKDDLPLDHPNGMCTMVPNVVDDLTGQLADWFNSEDGTYPEIDEFVSNFGYKANVVQTKLKQASKIDNNLFDVSTNNALIEMGINPSDYIDGFDYDDAYFNNESSLFKNAVAMVSKDNPRMIKVNPNEETWSAYLNKKGYMHNNVDKQSTLVHELGHTIDFQNRGKLDDVVSSALASFETNGGYEEAAAVVAKRYGDTVTQSLIEEQKLMGEKAMGMLISPYATGNNSEMFAEALADVFKNGVEANKWSTTIVKGWLK